MLRIFAKVGTSEKIACLCKTDQVQALLLEFNIQYGGDWVPVDDVRTSYEILKFDDGLVYRGFHGFDKRYSAAITKFTFRG